MKQDYKHMQDNFECFRNTYVIFFPVAKPFLLNRNIAQRFPRICDRNQLCKNSLGCGVEVSVVTPVHVFYAYDYSAVYPALFFHEYSLSPRVLSTSSIFHILTWIFFYWKQPFFASDNLPFGYNRKTMQQLAFASVEPYPWLSST